MMADFLDANGGLTYFFGGKKKKKKKKRQQSILHIM
jgi:hypothetical protein